MKKILIIFLFFLQLNAYEGWQCIDTTFKNRLAFGGKDKNSELVVLRPKKEQIRMKFERVAKTPKIGNYKNLGDYAHIYTNNILSLIIYYNATIPQATEKIIIAHLMQDQEALGSFLCTKWKK